MLSGIGMSGRILHYNLLDLSFEHTKEWQQYTMQPPQIYGEPCKFFSKVTIDQSFFFLFCPKVFFRKG